MAIILSGESLAKRILANLKKKRRRNLSLAIVQVGENPVSEKYIGEKKKAAQFLNVGVRVFRFPVTVAQAQLTQRVREIGIDPHVSGMIVQLPLPKHLNTQLILDVIPQHKDVDVLSSSSFTEFVLGAFPILPPTVAAISLLLKTTKQKLEGTQVAVVGAGRLVGLPVSLWLAQQGAVVSLIQKGTINVPQLIKKADIVISGVGKAGLITGKMIKRGAVVIDAGTSVEAGQTKGDVDFESVKKKANYISPVPGGVGPLTVAYLFHNLSLLSSKKFNAT